MRDSFPGSAQDKLTSAWLRPVLERSEGPVLERNEETTLLVTLNEVKSLSCMLVKTRYRKYEFEHSGDSGDKIF